MLPHHPSPVGLDLDGAAAGAVGGAHCALGREGQLEEGEGLGVGSTGWGVTWHGPSFMLLPHATGQTSVTYQPDTHTPLHTCRGWLMRSSSVWAARGARWGAGAPGMTGMGAGEGCKWEMEMRL